MRRATSAASKCSAPWATAGSSQCSTWPSRSTTDSGPGREQTRPTSRRPSVPAMLAVSGVSASVVHCRDAVAPVAVASAMESWPLMPFGAGVATTATWSGAPIAQAANVIG